MAKHILLRAHDAVKQNQVAQDEADEPRGQTRFKILQKNINELSDMVKTTLLMVCISGAVVTAFCVSMYFKLNHVLRVLG